MNHIASASGIAGEAIDGSPPAIGNSPVKARIAATTLRRENAADLGSVIVDMIPLRRSMSMVAVVEARQARWGLMDPRTIPRFPLFHERRGRSLRFLGGRRVSLLR